MDFALELDPIDILINNAGVFDLSELYSPSIKEWDHLFNVNVRAHYLLIKTLFLFGKFKPNAVIYNINSTDIITHPMGQVAYNSSKAALHELTMSLNKELSRIGIIIDEILLPPVATDMMKVINPLNPLPSEVLIPEEAAMLIVNELEGLK